MPANTSEAPAPAVTHVVVERPEPGLARGQYAWPAWAIASLGTVVVLLALVFWGLRIRKHRAGG